MLKLMKYEFRKQLFSKFAILGLLGLMELWFLYGVIMDKEKTCTTATVFLMILAFVGIFYVSFECIITFNNDLKTKQSYMLFMVPQSTYSIMGAKVLSAMIQIVLTALVFGFAAFADIMAIAVRYGEIGQLIDLFRDILREFLNLDIDARKVMIVIASVVIGWVSTIVLGMFSITLSTTFMANSRAKGIVSFLIFIVINVIIFKLNSLITNGLQSTYTDYLWSILFSLAVSIALYFGTAWMLEKKVSV